jgi:hypothetical protein
MDNLSKSRSGEAEREIALYTEAKSLRSPHEEDWRRAAMHVLPAHYASWQSDGDATYSQKVTAAQRQVYDTTGKLSLPKYASVLQRMGTPDGQPWHDLRPSDRALRQKRRVREYFELLVHELQLLRNAPTARFKLTFGEMYSALGTYGNGPIFVGERAPKAATQQHGIKYVSCPMKDCFALYDDDGEMCGFFRRSWLNVRQFARKWGADMMPPSMREEAKKPTPSESAKWEFVHYVRLADDYDAGSIGRQRFPFKGSVIAVSDKQFIGEHSGYQSMPYIMPRIATEAGDSYGYSPAMLALSSLGGASAIKRTNLRQGNKAVDPVLLTRDRGPVDLRPGAINPGGIDRQGNKTVQALDAVGNFRVAETLLQDERRDVEDAFFVTLFQILTETPEMTATEVVERVAEKAALLAPAMGRLQTEALGPTIDREISVLTELGRLPPMPPELIEAQGEYEVMYTSPLAKSIHAEEVSGFMRSVEMSLNVAQGTGDMSHLDWADFDTAMPEINDTLGVPVRWTRTVDAIEKVRAQRAEQQQQSELVQNAAGLGSAAAAMNGMDANG